MHTVLNLKHTIYSCIAELTTIHVCLICQQYLLLYKCYMAYIRFFKVPTKHICGVQPVFRPMTITIRNVKICSSYYSVCTPFVIRLVLGWGHTTHWTVSSRPCHTVKYLNMDKCSIGAVVDIFQNTSCSSHTETGNFSVSIVNHNYVATYEPHIAINTKVWFVCHAEYFIPTFCRQNDNWGNLYLYLQ